MELRDEIVSFIDHWQLRSGIALCVLIGWLGISRCRYYDWRKRQGQPNEHNAPIPKKHWVTEAEHTAILSYAMENLEAGYRRLTYLMLDADIAAVSPTTTYRILSQADMLNPRKYGPSKKGTGFEQPLKAHEHWHIDFSHIRLGSEFYFLVAVLDGYSRAIVSWAINETMTEDDAQIAIQRGLESYPGAAPRIISDNGKQFLSGDFKSFIKTCELTHVTTSPYYPQSNGKLERFNGTIKGECIRKNCPVDLEDARRITTRYVDDYNHVRLHGALGYVTPMSRLEGRDVAIKADRKQKLAVAKAGREQEYMREQAEQIADKEKSIFSSEKIHDNLAASGKERGQEVPQPQPDDRKGEVRTILEAERPDATEPHASVRGSN